MKKLRYRRIVVDLFLSRIRALDDSPKRNFPGERVTRTAWTALSHGAPRAATISVKCVTVEATGKASFDFCPMTINP